MFVYHAWTSIWGFGRAGELAEEPAAVMSLASPATDSNHLSGEAYTKQATAAS